MNLEIAMTLRSRVTPFLQGTRTEAQEFINITHFSVTFLKSTHCPQNALFLCFTASMYIAGLCRCKHPADLIHLLTLESWSNVTSYRVVVHE